MRRIAAAFVLSLALSASAFAHGDVPHIQGTVVSANDTTLVVKTRDGKTETLVLDPSTKVMRGKARATLQDLKAGSRVVVHPMKHGEALMATEVDLPPAAKSGKK
jgi:hypothetical protein